MRIVTAGSQINEIFMSKSMRPRFLPLIGLYPLQPVLSLFTRLALTRLALNLMICARNLPISAPLKSRDAQSMPTHGILFSLGPPNHSAAVPKHPRPRERKPRAALKQGAQWRRDGAIGHEAPSAPNRSRGAPGASRHTPPSPAAHSSPPRTHLGREEPSSSQELLPSTRPKHPSSQELLARTYLRRNWWAASSSHELLRPTGRELSTGQ